ncbi:protein MraZ [Enterococcus pernyi]|uniref:Transcriptional regulator MraZ n=2 Tax=Enterococcus mundtii TaxID=53346 RepID=A0A1V2UKL2_ENTMU|nr:protein MraZ [Enterococcus mundtii ATCC 882]ONN43751.1 cell division/cell wall cluster transcriptional repressor MraZ [Enterococcus mundtii]BAO06408.1 cell division protein MraZ [Enterococcus mundtii QU 25]EOU12119.1 protein MraZ [Enterococcus mundtii ATCC 882]BBM15687.1 cell division protein MraZ [Enterococcus mundtii]
MGDCGRLILVSGGLGVVSMLMGEFRHNIDAKGRLIVPSKLREELGEQFVLTRGLDGCLFGYPMSEWNELESKLNDMPLAKKDARTFVRFFYSAATECELDKQGRINIPNTLRNYATITKECVIVGVSNRIEIWDEAKWQEFSEAAEENFNEIAENMIDFGL